MKQLPFRTLSALCLSAQIALLTGCAAFRASTTNVDVEKEKHFDADYDYSDMRNITRAIANDLLASEFLRSQTRPTFIIAGVANHTSEYFDDKLLTDRIRTIVFTSGKAQFVNEARREDLLKEQGYQAANVTPETQVAIGRQLGARYMLSGSFAQMRNDSPKQVRVSKQKLNYYKLTMEVTDLETGLLVWTKDIEFARQASLPLIGW